MRTGQASPRTVDTAFEYYRQVFDQFYAAASREYPQTIFYGMHTYWSCLPDRIMYHDKALAYMKGMGDVTFTRGKSWLNTGKPPILPRDLPERRIPRAGDKSWPRVRTSTSECSPI